MLAGVPQWFAVRAVPYNSNVVGSSSESDFCYMNTLDKTTAPYNAAVASHTITGGPTTTSPVMIEVNGVMWALPFNVGTSAPDYVWQTMILASAAGSTNQYAGATWVWS